MSPRKPKGDKPMERLFNLKISNELYEALEEAHWQLRKPMAEVVREALIDYLKKNMPKDKLGNLDL